VLESRQVLHFHKKLHQALQDITTKETGLLSVNQGQGCIQLHQKFRDLI